MGETLTVDFTDIDKVMAEYIVLSRQSVSTAIKHQLKNWCQEAYTLVKKANKEQIGQFHNIFKLISWLLSHNSDSTQKEKVMFNKQTVSWKPVKNDEGSIRMREIKDVEFFTSSNATGKSYMDKNGNIRVRYPRFKSIKEQRSQGRMQYFSRAYAKDFAPRHINKRKNAAFFSSMFLLKMALNKNQEASAKGIVITSSEEDSSDNIMNAIVSRYAFKLPTTYALQNNTKTANHVEQVSIAALQSTADKIIPNMEEYIASHLPGQTNFKGVD